jgi:uncharacterized membrane protein
MARFRPLHAVVIVTIVLGAMVGAERLLSGNTNRYERVTSGRDGNVAIDTASMKPLEVRFFRFLNSGNQEVRFLVARDERGVLQVAFDASENDFKMKRGFHAEDGWIVNNKCSTSFHLAEINDQPSGCAPVPLAHRVDGDRLVLAENDILNGWRYFR